MRSKLILILAIIMGGVTTYLFYLWVEDQSIETVAYENMIEVVMASQAIQKNQRITADMLTITEVPAISVHSQTIRDSAEVIGSFATSFIEQGEIMLAHRLQNETEEQLFVSRKVKEGFRAASVGVSFVRSVANLIEPEDIIDVVVTEEVEVNGEEEIQSKMILSGIRVLAVDRRMVELDSKEAYAEYNTVTLELDTKQSVDLINASERGIIQLILHGKEEHIHDEQSG